ncbi:hypothetical protein BDW42DRAFT_153791 [Aspergillus taichungensis]|uniref:Uncharacterized protein n=1 Tax=Aspergillus taichungensis TaxID=482145 RepID=A0A2J5HKY4_9EURO|nr:hypothetical protein BDW42DRAFT_153791 [Aspergillus taichungensis]
MTTRLTNSSRKSGISGTVKSKCTVVMDHGVGRKMNWAPRSPSMDPDRNTPDIDAIPFSTRNRHPALIILPQVF